MTGIKYDAGKPLPDLVLGDFMAALEQAVFAGTFGAAKYEPKNFQQLENGETRYAEAAFRHYIARKKGELHDIESGEFHHAHELWCRIAELYFWLIANQGREFEKAISRSDGLYHHPSLDEFDQPWASEPFWYSEHDARQIVWALAQEQKGELDIHVTVREIKDYEDLVEVPVVDLHFSTQAECDDFVKRVSSMLRDETGPCYLYNFLNDDYYAGNNSWSRDTQYAIVYERPVPGLLSEMPNTMFVDVKVDVWPDQADDDRVFISYFDKWLSGYTEFGISEYATDALKAVGIHRHCAEKFIAEHPDLPLKLQEDIWHVQAESGDFYQGDGIWTDLVEEAASWTKGEAAERLRCLDTKTRLVAA
jgi:hypothetical protein